MAFKKGVSGNPAGRPKGSGNRATSDLRASIQAFLDKNWPNVQKEFNKLEPKEKLAFMDKMLSYSLPKLQSVELDADVELNHLSDQKIDSIIEKLLSK